jgi:predicted nucleic acid-binding protein
MRRVCLDANVWVKILTEEPDTQLAEQLVSRLFRERSEIIAPAIMKMEVGSILRRKWSRKLLTEEHLNELWHQFLSLPIIFIEQKHIYEIAWEIAENNQLVHLYDAVYLAVSTDIEFWTADKRLVNSVRETKAIVKLLGKEE